MGKAFNVALKIAVALGLITLNAFAESGDNTVVRLYQIGRDGSYCLSITKDQSGCVSGEDDAGKNINILDFIKGKRVVFENLSDAPHDMKFSGANAQDLPVQQPNGADAVKQIAAVDMTPQKISCSFHGAQLGVGYRAPNASGSQIQEGHKETGYESRPNVDTASGIGGETTAGGGASRKITRTGLADVSGEVLAKGRQADVEKLVAARPELLNKLQELRPLLAQEIAAGAAGPNAKLASAGTGSGSALDSNFGANGGGAGSVGAAVAGGGGGKPGMGLFGSAGGGKNADGSPSDSSLGGVGRKDTKRLLSAANSEDEASEGHDAGWASSILGNATEKDESETGRGVQTASVGLNGTPDRTKLKNVSKAKRNLSSIEDNSPLRGWLLLVLLGVVAIAARMVLFATKAKKEKAAKGLEG